MTNRISQRDLAKLAGVSPMTVSLALRDHPSPPSAASTSASSQRSTATSPTPRSLLYTPTAVTPTGGRNRPLPVLLGFTPPPMGENAGTPNERPARGVTLRNQTLMPVVLGAKAEQCKIFTTGPIQQNLGKKNEVTPLKP